MEENILPLQPSTVPTGGQENLPDQSKLPREDQFQKLSVDEWDGVHRPAKSSDFRNEQRKNPLAIFIIPDNFEDANLDIHQRHERLGHGGLAGPMAPLFVAKKPKLGSIYDLCTLGIPTGGRLNLPASSSDENKINAGKIEIKKHFATLYGQVKQGHTIVVPYKKNDNNELVPAFGGGIFKGDALTEALIPFIVDEFQKLEGFCQGNLAFEELDEDYKTAWETSTLVLPFPALAIPGLKSIYTSYISQFPESAGYEAAQESIIAFFKQGGWPNINYSIQSRGEPPPFVTVNIFSKSDQSKASLIGQITFYFHKDFKRAMAVGNNFAVTKLLKEYLSSPTSLELEKIDREADRLEAQKEEIDQADDDDDDELEVEELATAPPTTANAPQKNITVGGQALDNQLKQPETDQKGAIGLIIAGTIVAIPSIVLFALAFGILASVIANPFFLLIPLVIGVGAVIGGVALYAVNQSRRESLNVAGKEDVIPPSVTPFSFTQQPTITPVQPRLFIPTPEDELSDDIKKMIQKICASSGANEEKLSEVLKNALKDADITSKQRIQNTLQGVLNDSNPKEALSAIYVLCGTEEKTLFPDTKGPENT